MGWTRKNSRGHYSSRTRRPQCCNGIGRNGDKGRAKWVRISSRKMRRKEKQERVFSSTPHRRYLLRHYQAPDILDRHDADVDSTDVGSMGKDIPDESE